MTVSRAIRHPASVSEATRQRIHEVIEEIGYVPNRVAGSLASNRTNLVAALVPNIGNPLFAETVEGLAEVLHQHGLHVAIGHTGHSIEEEEALIATFLANRPCGMLLHATTHTARARRLLAGSGVTVVESGNLAANPIDVVVSYSNYEAGRALTGHLIARGYRRIGLIGWPERGRAREVRRGYLSALRQSGLEADPLINLELSHGIEAGAQAVAQLVEGGQPVDAAIFLGVNAAIGAVLECHRRGIDIPGQIAIACMDDSELARLIQPPLTCVAIPRREFGQQAANVIVNRLGGRPIPTPVIDLGFRVIPRAST